MTEVSVETCFTNLKICRLLPILNLINKVNFTKKTRATFLRDSNEHGDRTLHFAR